MHGNDQLHFLQTLIDRVPSPIFYKDIHGYYLGCNKAFEDYHGIEREKLIGRNDADLAKDHQKALLCKTVDPDPLKHPGTRRYETFIKHPDGSERTVIIEEAAFTDIAGNVAGVVGIINDITGIITAEKERMRVGKLESLGILAGGIAHDFNNILAMILGNITLAKIYGDVNAEKLRHLLESAEEAVMRAKDLTRQLLTFSKGGTPVKKIMPIQGLLKSATAFTLAGTDIKSEFDIPLDLPAVEIDENQISQVIGNIVLNAQQAMPHGGKVSTRAENIVFGNAGGSLKKGHYIKISISDQGIGIPEEYLDMVFDPYFTTKEQSGLGLSICYSVIQKHQGHIGVESTLGIGTTFVIYLPVVQIQQTTEMQSKKTVVMNGNGKILVMDDEETIRSIVGDILQYLGYTVDFARDGEEAIDLYSRKPYDAVILDLTIPGGMGGKETIRHLLDIDPAIKAIVSSGYSNDPIMSDYAKYGFKGVIVKPYTIHEISSALRNVIS